ncbi:MAG: sulfatase [Cyclobacteriaceae bacterium]
MHKFRLVLLTITMLLGVTSLQESLGQDKKNVLFIIVDDLNPTLGTYGHPTVLTPNIDKLAEQGVQFNRAYSNFSLCNPSRSSFLSGLLPETLGITENKTSLQSVIGDRVTMPELFRKNGYHAASLGKVFHGRREHNDPNAWDEIHGFGPTELGKTGEQRDLTDGALTWCWWRAAEGDDLDQPDGKVAQKAIEIIKQKRDKPFFLAVGFHKPHDPFIAPKKYFDMYPLVSCDPPPVPEVWSLPYAHSLDGRVAKAEVFDKFTDQDKREFLRSYYACTSFMDAQVGKVLKALNEEGLSENTLIVFMGDHGYHLGEHQWWNKVSLYEKGQNAPLIIVDGDESNKGLQSNAMVEFIDLYPTMAELSGLKNIPGHLEGKSFTNVIDNPLRSFRDVVYGIVGRGETLGRSIKTDDWRYIEWDEGKMSYELYNEKSDPIEYQNLANNKKYAKVMENMRELMREYQQGSLATIK